jgi:hypothetical protein
VITIHNKGQKMATETDTSIQWFRDFFEGRTRDEIETIKRVTTASFTATGGDEVITARKNECPQEKRKGEGHERLIAAFADWLKGRALANAPKQNEDLINFGSELESDAVRRLIGERAWLDWQVWQKFEILDHYMHDIDEGWYDLRVARLLASIKADLRNLGIGVNE